MARRYPYDCTACKAKDVRTFEGRRLPDKMTLRGPLAIWERLCERCLKAAIDQSWSQEA